MLIPKKVKHRKWHKGRSRKRTVDHYVFPVRPGRIIFEIDGVEKKVASEALRLASFKLPFKSKIIIKE